MTDPAVEFVAREPGLAERLLADHGDDGSGHCERCTGGSQSGRHVWPCQIHDLAVKAREMGGAVVARTGRAELQDERR